jgi:hypothetical protein
MILRQEVDTPNMNNLAASAFLRVDVTGDISNAKDGFTS